MSKYKKLVRDCIPDIIRSNNEVPVTQELNGEEYKEALFEKLIEEANEVVEANGKEELKKEIGDVQEVLYAVMKAYDISNQEVDALRSKRKEERGGFDAGIFLEDVEEK